MMKISFLHPPFDKRPTGGNIYNRNMVEQAALCGFPLDSVPSTEPQLDATLSMLEGRPLICDSLFLAHLAQRRSAAPWALLLHYLPSENPMLDAPERRRIEEMEARAAQKADVLIASGRSLERTLRERFPGKRVFVCEPGVSTPFLDESSPSEREPGGTVELLTVANLLPAKGHLQLLRILADLTQYNWRWHLVGDDSLDSDYAAYFRDTARRIGLRAMIHYHGVLSPDEIAALMGRCDVFVSASHYESYGMALAEAAARKLPSVHTQVGAAGRLIRHDRTGFLVHPGDWEGFAHCLARLLREAKLRERFRHNLQSIRSRTWAEAFTDFRVACKTVSDAARRLASLS